MLFEPEKLLLAQNEFDRSYDLDARTAIMMTKDKCEKYMQDLARRRQIAHEADLIGILPVDWRYYFAVIASARWWKREKLIAEMNKALTEAGVLCRRSPDCFGIIKNGYNLSHFSASDLNHGQYFAKSEYAHGYLNAAIKSGNARRALDFVFQIHDIKLGIPKP
ncbi:MAG: hypothetical protein WCT26_05050 [Candidatus Buchananbacteria bacterium]|jgi:hypothetical protein